MALPIIDYHMHTHLCGHADGEPRDYAQQAIKVGLEEIGFTDHAPFVHMVDPKVTMGIEQLPTYYKMIENIRQEYVNDLRIKVALEVDFISGYEDKTQAIINDYPYDYIIGSVHFIKDWAFDDPSIRESWDNADINQVCRDYYELLRQSAKSGMFDIMGHVDLVKKFGHRATEDMRDEVKKTAQVFKEMGVAVEINTAGLRKPVGEMYPAQNCLQIYFDAGVPLTFGSDAHTPGNVGKDFEKAVDLAKLVGYSEYVLFKERKIERAVKI